MISRPAKIFLLGLPLLAAMAAAAWWLPPDGRERSAWLQVAGRFHPLAVHLPIGLLVLVPVMEIVGGFRRWGFLRVAAGFVLGLGALTAAGAVVLGWLLAYAGGYSGDLVLRHMWGGVALSAACVLAIALRPALEARPDGGRRARYFGALALMTAALTWTGHQGGSLTRGENYLVERLPESVQARFGLGAKKKSAAHPYPTAFYATHVQPLFENNCVVCHGPGKTQGKLLLDTFAHTMAGGEHGPVVIAADVAPSELHRRITLPRDHKEFMPSEGKKPLDAREVKLLGQWIEFGASPSETFAELLKRGADLPKDETPAEPWAPDYRPRAAEFATLERELGVRLLPVSQVATDGIVLRTVSDPSRVDDAALAQLAPAAEFIVDAELARTKITDAGLRTVAAWKNLRRIDLSQTAVSTAGLSALSVLPKLEWLSAVDTRVDPGARDTLKLFPALRTSYLPLPPAAPKVPEPAPARLAWPKEKSGGLEKPATETSPEQLDL